MPIRFPLPLNSISKAGKDITQEFMISLSDPVEDRDLRRRGNSWKCQFSFQIPDHIYEYLAGKTVPSNKFYGGDVAPKKYGASPKEGFPKTLSWHNLNDLIQIKWEPILEDYRWLKDIEKSEGLQKVIYFEFDNAHGQYQDEWTMKNRLGYISRIKFVYAIGYHVKNGTSTGQRYDSNMILLPVSEHLFYRMKHIRWTEEREHFFNSLQVDFERVISRIGEFESHMRERKIDKLISGGLKMIGAGAIPAEEAKPIKLGPKALSILRYLAQQNRNNAETTRYYAPDWKPLAKLRELGFIEPGDQNMGSVVTDMGRGYLKGMES